MRASNLNKTTSLALGLITAACFATACGDDEPAPSNTSDADDTTGGQPGTETDPGNDSTGDEPAESTGDTPDPGTDSGETDSGSETGVAACDSATELVFPAGAMLVTDFATDPGNTGKFSGDTPINDNSTIAVVATDGSACPGAFEVVAPFTAYFDEVLTNCNDDDADPLTACQNDDLDDTTLDVVCIDDDNDAGTDCLDDDADDTTLDTNPTASGQNYSPGQLDGQLNYIAAPVDWTGFATLHVWIKLAAADNATLTHLANVAVYVASPTYNRLAANYPAASVFADGMYHEVIVDLAGIAPADLAAIGQIGIQVNAAYNEYDAATGMFAPPAGAPAAPVTTTMYVDDVWLAPAP